MTFYKSTMVGTHHCCNTTHNSFIALNILNYIQPSFSYTLWQSLARPFLGFLIVCFFFFLECHPVEITKLFPSLSGSGQPLPHKNSDGGFLAFCSLLAHFHSMLNHIPLSGLRVHVLKDSLDESLVNYKCVGIHLQLQWTQVFD